MIENWLQSYQPVATILSGTRTITNARLFADDMPSSAGCLYIGRISDFFPESTSSQILLMHQQDILSVRSDDLNRIFNLVLSAFDFYNDMEAKMLVAFTQPNPEQGILSACECLLGPTFLMGRDYRILAVSQNYSGKHVNEFWENFIRYREPSVEMTYNMRNSNAQKLMEGNQFLRTFREPKAYPYDYGVCSTYSTSKGEVIGTLIIASDAPISSFELDMANILMAMLTQLQQTIAITKQTDTTGITSEILLNNLLNNIDQERSSKYLAASLNVKGTEVYHMIALCPENEVLIPSIEHEMRSLFQEIVLVRQNAVILSLVFAGNNATIIRQIEEKFHTLLGRQGIKIGVSNPFRGLFKCVYFARQAIYAASVGEAGVVVFKNVASRYLLSVPEELDRRYARYPQIELLEEKDTAENSELITTLREYLICERSVKKAAERLHVHRNTVLYRIGLIHELIDFDLDDPNDRLYLLLSLLNS